MNSEKLKKAVEEILKEDGFEFDEIVEVSNVKNTSDFVTGAASSIPNPAKIVFSYTSKKEVEACNKREEENRKGLLSRFFVDKREFYLDNHVFKDSIQDGRLIQYLLEKI